MLVVKIYCERHNNKTTRHALVLTKHQQVSNSIPIFLVRDWQLKLVCFPFNSLKIPGKMAEIVYSSHYLLHRMWECGTVPPLPPLHNFPRQILRNARSIVSQQNSAETIFKEFLWSNTGKSYYYFTFLDSDSNIQCRRQFASTIYTSSRLIAATSFV